MTNNHFNCQQHLDYCVAQAKKTLEQLPQNEMIPRSIPPGNKHWNLVNFEDWTSGFWPGILWQLYEYTRDKSWKTKAEYYSNLLLPLSTRPAKDHDLGFQVFLSLGQGFRLSKKAKYKQALLKTANRLASLYNPKVGTILSWPGMVKKMNWPHNTIIDNMINLELLFWASSESRELSEIARQHAQTTMHNHFRKDNTCYHVVVYDPTNGNKIKGVTHQGYSDESMWARGQAWAIYGFTMTFRLTRDYQYLEFAQKVTDVYLDRLPKNGIPHWDFNVPNTSQEPLDASAAAITASALLELCGYVTDPKRAHYFKNQAVNMIQTLSTPSFQSCNNNPAFLMHSTGHYPLGSEIDYSIIYADYYYLEALIRLKKIQEGCLSFNTTDLN